jgi:hypothetical protein
LGAGGGRAEVAGLIEPDCRLSGERRRGFRLPDANSDGWATAHEAGLVKAFLGFVDLMAHSFPRQARASLNERRISQLFLANPAS